MTSKKKRNTNITWTFWINWVRDSITKKPTKIPNVTHSKEGLLLCFLELGCRCAAAGLTRRRSGWPPPASVEGHRRKKKTDPPRRKREKRKITNQRKSQTINSPARGWVLWNLTFWFCFFDGHHRFDLVVLSLSLSWFGGLRIVFGALWLPAWFFAPPGPSGVSVPWASLQPPGRARVAKIEGATSRWRRWNWWWNWVEWLQNASNQPSHGTSYATCCFWEARGENLKKANNRGQQEVRMWIHPDTWLLVWFSIGPPGYFHGPLRGGPTGNCCTGIALGQFCILLMSFLHSDVFYYFFIFIFFFYHRWNCLILARNHGSIAPGAATM